MVLGFTSCHLHLFSLLSQSSKQPLWFVQVCSAVKVTDYILQKASSELIGHGK